MSATASLHRQVYVSGGGRRFHTNRLCRALESGQYLNEPDAAEWVPGVPWPRVRPVRQQAVLNAVADGYTACRVCVPPADALPATGRTFGHEPVPEMGPWERPEVVCARCTYRGLRWAIGGRNPRLARVGWPCTSAVVLGLYVSDADRWNQQHPVGTPVLAWPGARWDEPLRTRTRTPAWRLGHGDSVVSVDGYAGGICLTHVEPR